MSSQETLEVRESLLSGAISNEQAIQKLTDSGIESEAARELVSELIRQHKKALFDQTIEKRKSEERRGIAFFATLMISLIGPVFELKSTALYLVVVLAASVAGYLAYKDRPIAGIASFFCFASVFPFTYANYFASRHSYVRIELLIPVILTAVPSFILLYLLSKLIYKKGLV